MPIRKFTNGRFSLKRFTAPGVGGGAGGGSSTNNAADGGAGGAGGSGILILKHA
jgi:hypothetical protein